MKKLIGHVIEEIMVNEGEDTLVFKTDEGYVVFVVDGDCCSTSWFADILAPEALIGETVNHVRELSLWPSTPTGVDTREVAHVKYAVNDGRTRQDEDKAYGWQLLTSKGYVDIIFRNSSNGYYGGSIDEGTVYGALPMRLVNMKWTQIKSDWSA